MQLMLMPASWYAEFLHVEVGRNTSQEMKLEHVNETKAYGGMKYPK